MPPAVKQLVGNSPVHKMFFILPALVIAAAAHAQNSAPVEAPGRTDWQPLIADMTELATQQLAAALAHAYSAHIAAARPLPQPVQDFLQGIIPDEFIKRARFTVSTDTRTLPGLLNQGHRAYRNEDNAVSIDNLIIFSREPGFDTGTDARWWAHELGHHLQYQRLGGIQGFARQYVLNFQGLEREAETYGEKALNKYVEMYR